MPNNEAQEHINKAALLLANFQALMKAANKALDYSKIEFEAANEASLTKKCPVRQQLENNLRGHYEALFQHLEACEAAVAAIATELQKPTLQRMLNSIQQDEWKIFSKSINDPIDGKYEETLTLTELCQRLPNLAGLACSLEQCEKLEVTMQDYSIPVTLTIKSAWNPSFGK